LTLCCHSAAGGRLLLAGAERGPPNNGANQTCFASLQRMSSLTVIS